MAEVRIKTIQSGSVDVEVIGLSEEYSYDGREFVAQVSGDRDFGNIDAEASVNVDAGDTEVSITVEGLGSDTTYYLQVEIRNIQGESGFYTITLIYQDNYGNPKPFKTKKSGTTPVIDSFSARRYGENVVQCSFVLSDLTTSNEVKLFAGGDENATRTWTNLQDGKTDANILFSSFLYDDTLRLRVENESASRPFPTAEETIHCPYAYPFSWSVPKVRNGMLVVTAAEWNAFCAKIAEWREYKGIPVASDYFTRVNPSGLGQGAVISSSMKAAHELAHPHSVITADIIDEAIGAINGMLPYADRIEEVSAGDVIEADLFDEMVTKLNGLS